MYAQVVFALPFRNEFTYSIPKELSESVSIGMRVVVSFGKRTLTGFVVGISETTDIKEKVKPIKDALDELPIFTKESIEFYKWISNYYLSSLGEALRNSVPYGTDVESKRKIVADKVFCKELLENEKKKTSVKAKLLEVLSEKEVTKISYLQKATGKKNIYTALRMLEKEGAISILNEIEDAKVRVKKQKHAAIAKPLDDIYKVIPEIESNSPKQVVLLLELLSHKNEDVLLSDLLKKTKAHQSSATSLEKKGLIKIFDKEIDRVYIETYKEKHQTFELTGDQKIIVDEVGEKIDQKKFESYLLYGVTGSGKTQVYIELTKKAIENKKTALILVPEISLTPQITSRFFNNFGERVTVLHSRMSLGERYDSWRGIVSGKYTVVIGPRSALFAPLNHIGVIVVDEEHDSSYKQWDMVPKYHARDAAIVRAKFSGCPVVLGSATPSIESMYNANSGKYKLLQLKNRIDDAKLPSIRLIDVTSLKKKNLMQNIFSKPLLDAIDQRVKKKEGVIILQNRRGFSTQVYCEDCGEIEMCPDCSVSMVHHIDKNIMRCHYCGITKSVPRACSNCGSIAMKFFGTGTQRVEDELEYYFPSIKLERVDSDSMSKKGKLGIILNQFGKGEIDVLIGTQMVSKGLDFANVTLVGVISAETTLWLPDFRADERTFQLLTQVAGRSGRSKNPGEVLIQTQNQNHFVLQKVLQFDYEGFYKNELMMRERGGYPPFTRLCLIEVKDQIEEVASGAIRDFHKYLTKKKSPLEILPPTPAVIAKLKGQYRFQILIKSGKRFDPSGRIMRERVLDSFIEFNQKSRFRDVKIYIDVDPQSVV
ncbi:MAG: primosomal protein N' [Melioribacteraceae bacterium]|nr:primosomal protein N' [Melioribacteraceae bacterium]MCF8356684.1 primosomal protein N' [Melioribacteraceae bacterium]MCF8395554.1 primosomal protein N' [Melioribacteraceae bacterium]MCF8420854.1 primosomal protein N' [Melioribacteraceae bacterium]